MFNSDVKMAQKLKLGKPDFPRWSLPEVWARLAGKEFRLEVVLNKAVNKDQKPISQPDFQG